MPIIAIIGKDESNKKPWGNWGLRVLLYLLIWLGRALDVYVVNVKGYHLPEPLPYQLKLLLALFLFSGGGWE